MDGIHQQAANTSSASVLRAMPIQKRGLKYRARLSNKGTWHHGPLRVTEQEAAEDMRRLAAAKDEGPDAIVTLMRELQAAPSGTTTSRAGWIEQRFGNYRARVKKIGCSCVGPQRTSKAEAEADLQKLLEAADISVTALKDAADRLSTAGPSIEEHITEAMSVWLRQRSTAARVLRSRCVSEGLRSRVRRTEAASDQGRALDAARKLVDAHLAAEALATDVAAGWLRELGLHFRLDSDSRPRGTTGLVQAPGHTGLRNLGNTCYVNSVIQCIRSCKPLLRDLADETQHKGPLGRRLRDVLHQLQGQEWDYVAPFHLMHQLYLTDPGTFVPGASSDAAEACALFLDKCVSDKTVCISTSSAEGPCLIVMIVLREGILASRSHMRFLYRHIRIE